MDIMEAIARIRHGFKSSNLEPPTMIMLKSHDEGMRFLSELRQNGTWTAMAGSPDLGHPVEMADGSIYMEIKVMDIAVRWPSNRYATPDGSWKFV